MNSIFQESYDTIYLDVNLSAKVVLDQFRTHENSIELNKDNLKDFDKYFKLFQDMTNEITEKIIHLRFFDSVNRAKCRISEINFTNKTIFVKILNQYIRLDNKYIFD
jgi:hypothetical protein